jgi:hypothetical protein
MSKTKLFYDKRMIGWKMDMDPETWKKFTTEEKEYYIKFCDEYYLSYYKDNPIHTKPEHIKDNKDRDNAQSRDLSNLSDSFVRLDAEASGLNDHISPPLIHEVIDSATARLEHLLVRPPTKKKSVES